jgi:hypothetical protein
MNECYVGLFRRLKFVGMTTAGFRVLILNLTNSLDSSQPNFLFLITNFGHVMSDLTSDYSSSNSNTQVCLFLLSRITGQVVSVSLGC